MRSPLRKHDRAHFFKYVTAEAGLPTIANRRRRWSSPLLFNDPFDVPRKAIFPFTDDELLEAISREFARLVASDEEPKEPTIAELVHHLRVANDPVQTSLVAASLGYTNGAFASVLRKSMADFRKHWEAIVPNLRIFCVSDISDSTPMWAHYADNHRGLVLQFGSSDELDSSLLLAQPVVYRKTAPVLPTLHVWTQLISSMADIDWQEIFREYYYVKARDWSYEREWRAISFSPDAEQSHFTDTGYHPAELEAVFVGAAATRKTNARLEDLLRTSDLSHVRVWHARHAHDNRTIAFDRVR